MLELVDNFLLLGCRYFSLVILWKDREACGLLVDPGRICFGHVLEDLTNVKH